MCPAPDCKGLQLSFGIPGRMDDTCGSWPRRSDSGLSLALPPPMPTASAGWGVGSMRQVDGVHSLVHQPQLEVVTPENMKGNRTSLTTLFSNFLAHTMLLVRESGKMNLYLFQTCFLQEGFQHTPPPTTATAALGPSLPRGEPPQPGSTRSRNTAGPRWPLGRDPGHDRPHPWTRPDLPCPSPLRHSGQGRRLCSPCRR